MYLGMNFISTALIFTELNLRYIISTFLIFVSYLANYCYLTNTKADTQFLNHYGVILCMVFLGSPLLFYISELDSKKYFMK
jgi:hypothetical protein